jgi:CO dehydrogenase/acetyl-CoA synthase alpha subunit
VLSRPALASLGVPVITGSDGQMVADMVISNDGTPQAIRVVDWQTGSGLYLEPSLNNDIQ